MTYCLLWQKLSTVNVSSELFKNLLLWFSVIWCCFFFSHFPVVLLINLYRKLNFWSFRTICLETNNVFFFILWFILCAFVRRFSFRKNLKFLGRICCFHWSAWPTTFTIRLFCFYSLPWKTTILTFLGLIRSCKVLFLFLFFPSLYTFYAFDFTRFGYFL